MVIQSTVWSGRQHCEDAVLAGLVGMDADCDILHVWTVHGRRQAERLRNRTPDSAAVIWNVLDATPVPQYGPSDDKRLASARGWGAAWRVLRDLEGDGLMLVDDDITFQPGMLARLADLARDTAHGAASGLAQCFNRKLSVFSLDPPGRLPVAQLTGSPMTVGAVGTFGLWLDDLAFAAMRREYQPALEACDGRLLGHDLHLCEWLHDHGIRLILDPAERVTHHVEIEPGNYCELTP